MQSIGLLLIRAMVGCVMAFHGAQKLFGVFDGPGMAGEDGFVALVTKLGFPVPMVSAYAAAVAEFLGGAMVVIGILTRLACIPVAATMYVAALQVHGGAFSAQAGGMEYALTLAVVTTGLFFTGPGVLSVDGLFSKRKKKDGK